MTLTERVIFLLAEAHREAVACAKRKKAVVAIVDKAGREVSAEFCLETGRLNVIESGLVLEAIYAPDSWMFLAASSTAPNWGTRPDAKDLAMFLEKFEIVDCSVKADEALARKTLWGRSRLLARNVFRGARRKIR
ncbi:hypothetical protein [Caballeronia novacaledonica]|uniref:Uncharacterized protein n=1 Tax=Caballeronia novacaledonica TaxID=1544861 RepID=A0AA37IDZ5_9BURK|nr:hypothetical protein [Caballeronia novacaledonica]GJH26994.1 hypothetical protein CBA19CS42_20780 [Caballeronia novacaledonica]